MDRTPFHPVIARWFRKTFAGPTNVQVEGWSEIARGVDTLIAAPTGSGKTLAAFLWAINRLVEAGESGALEDRTQVVYISPLKALSNDIEKNLRGPLSEIKALAESAGNPLPEIRIAVRTGDTPSRERQLQVKRPPHILITTPESLYILLTAERSRAMLRKSVTVIVDEIHAVAGNKRGAHLALSLERLDLLAGKPLQRIGLSATQKPVEEVARLLVGAGRCEPDGSPRCAIVNAGHRREMDVRVESGEAAFGAIATHEFLSEIYDRIAGLVEQHHTTIVFVNTRRLVERVAHALGERLGKDKVAAHHGSLSRETRLAAEVGLKSGALPVVVATASLELGIDIGHVDLVCHLGAPRSLATLIQRVGRSGHFLGAIPKGIILPLTRDDLLQAAAAVRAVYSGELDRLIIAENPLDILAQQIVATTVSQDIAVKDLWAMIRRAHPFRRLPREDFEAVLDMLSEGISSRRGRRSAHLHYDRLNGILRARRGARLAAIMNGGAIPDTADYDVVEEPAGTFVGRVNEDFAVESLAGDIFLLGNRSWRILRVESGRLRVADADGLPPTIPFWLGEAPSRTEELSAAVAALRRDVAERHREPEAAAAWLMAEARVDRAGAEQIVAYLTEAIAALGAVPTLDTIIAERFFDESGGMQVVMHTPFGGRINRALGLSLRKRFCLTFDFELQAAATDDGIVISLGEQHSFPLESIFSMVRSHLFEDDLVQATLVSPMFTNRWRWNVTRSLAVLRRMGGKRVPMPILRMRAEDLMASVFPGQVACGDNHAGPVEIPDHPLVNETIDNCLHEAMDAEGLRRILLAIEQGTIRTIAVETPAPSPLSHEILNANPYAFLDDAPLEERRARAVSLRRTDPDLASGIGALDRGAIDEVRRMAWPVARNADEVHDALLTLGVLPAADAEPWREHVEALIACRRVTRARIARDAPALLVAAERAALVRLAFPNVSFSPEPPEISPSGSRASSTARFDQRVPDSPRALAEIVRGWMDALGPVRADALAARLGVPPSRIEGALGQLEAEGVVLQGRYTEDAGDAIEWCERGLLSRIHRMTLGKLRKEIEAVTAADFMRFLFRWQHLHDGTKLHGREGIRAVMAQLEGLELPGPAWEGAVLPARIANYNANDLEQLCLSGEVAWGRLGVSPPAEDRNETAGEEAPRRRLAPTRAAPLAFFLRQSLEALLEPLPEGREFLSDLSLLAARVYDYLARRGASFLADIAHGVESLPYETEEALWELVATGHVTGDGVAGLRTLLMPEKERRERRARRRAAHLRALPGRGSPRLMPVGRWSLLRARVESTPGGDEAVEAAARRLLARYGVLFRDVCARERRLPPWRKLLYALRRLEARGEVRGGRFVEGFIGEQFALPEAVEALRAVRRKREGEELILVAAADPLNFAGILAPGTRVSPFSGQVIAYRDGTPVEIGELGAVMSRLQPA